MLVSRKHDIAFAHYPKTAGKSLQTWFMETFPDAVLLDEGNPHLDVTPSLQRLRPSRWARRANDISRQSLGLVSRSLARRCRLFPDSLRIVGVLRDPFEMLVSLFEFWKRTWFPVEPTDPFMCCARRGTFHDFVAAAVIGGRVKTYEKFFDVGGPLWRNTHLLDFESLQPALDTVCGTLGIRNARPLPSLNCAPEGRRDLSPYREEAGPLFIEVRRYFRWYYEEGVHLAIRGGRPLRAAA